MVQIKQANGKIQLRKVLNFLWMILISANSFSQFNSRNPSVPAANIAPGKQSLEISGDLFNGRVNVNLPVFNYDMEGVSVPITLNYSGGNGIKPDELPGWVGSGWNLKAGGYVHRTVRGRPDEALDFKTVIYNYKFSVYGYLTPPPAKRTLLLPQDYSYYTNCGRLNVSNWYTQTFANSITQSRLNYDQEFDAQDRIETWSNVNPVYDLVPDEFTFDLGNVSGKFYLNHLHKWVVDASDGKDYSISVSMGEQTVIDKIAQSSSLIFRYYYKIPRIIKTFTITSSDGIQYTFGNTYPNASFDDQYFDYSHSSMVFALDGNNRPYRPLNPGNVEPGYLDIVPHTWHLTKIENLKTNSTIVFNYKKARQFYKTRQAWGSPGMIVYKNDQIFSADIEDPDPWYRLSAMSKVFTRYWTLTSINFSNSVKIDFTSSVSTQLSTNENFVSTDNAGFIQYEDIGFVDYTGLNTLFKLDKISVSFNNSLKKEIEFNYTLSASQRLQLNNVRDRDLAGNFNGEYKFVYNTKDQIKLPPYGVGKNDHWGFYNDRDFFTLATPPFTNYNSLLPFSASKDPDVTGDYTSAEILTKLIYPTGGSVAFTYEPQTYSKKIDVNFTVTNLGTNNTGGGVRIKKVSYYTDDNTLAGEKIYEYLQPGSTTLSSGVLGSPIPNYLTSGGTGYVFRAQGINTIYYGGNNVTYTYATEREINNGRTQYEYTNYDNNFNDLPPLQSNFQGSYYNDFSYAYAHNAFKRGKPLTIKTFTEGGGLIKEIDFHYEHEKTETDKNEVRSVYLSAFNYPDKFSSVSERIYPDRLISQEEKNITASGTLSVKNYTSYDPYGNIKEIIAYDSKGSLIKQRFKYCYEYEAGGTDVISAGINFLNNSGFRLFLVEKITSRENADGSDPKIINASLYTYHPASANVNKVYSLEIAGAIPASTFVESTIVNGSFVKDPKYSTAAETSYDAYDSKGNILQQTDRNGIQTIYIWGYNKIYPVAKITGADVPLNNLYEQVTLDDPNSTEKQIRDQVNNIRSALAASGNKALVTTYTYRPLVGLSSETDANGRTTYYQYDGFGRLAMVWNNEKKIIKKICYDYAGQPEICLAATTWYSPATTYLVFRNNCPGNQIGVAMNVPVPAGQFMSTFSQEDADDQAQAYAQQVANAQGRCIDPVYARLEFIPLPTEAWDHGDETYTGQPVECWIKFYADPGYTRPLTLSRNINFSINEYLDIDYVDHFYFYDGIITGTALAGTNGYLIDGSLNLFGEWNIYDEYHNLTYMERWRDHYVIDLMLTDCGGGANFYNSIQLPAGY